MSMPQIFGLLLAIPLVLTLVGCASSGPPLPTVDQVDIDRYLGSWYVVGLMPNRIEEGAHLSVEHYSLRPDGKIDITYTFRKGGFDGEEKTLRMVARIVDEESRATWKVRPFWPVSLDYLVTDLAEDYRYTVIGHPSRNFAWIMSREKELTAQDWEGILERMEDQGFDTRRIVRVPQIPPGPSTEAAPAS